MDGSHMHLNALEALERVLELLQEKDAELQELYRQHNELIQTQRSTDAASGQAAAIVPLIGESLVVDAEAATRITISHRLMRSGLKVRTAADGIEAVEALARAKYDVLIFDYMTPRVQPLDFLTVMTKRRPDTAVIVMINGQPTPMLRDELLQAGAKLVLAKPFDFARLTGLVRQFVQRAATAEAA